MKAHIIVEKRIVKKPKSVKYEVFHIVESKDLMGNPIYVKQSVGTTELRNMEAEIKEYEMQIDYRKKVIEEINFINDNKLSNSNYEEKLKAFIADREELESKK